MKLSPHYSAVQYYGGTNFGRTASSFVTTRYYDEAPVDEYGKQMYLLSLSKFSYELISRLIFLLCPGLLREPKWGHLRDLHSALRLCKRALLWGTPSVQNLGVGFEVSRTIINQSRICLLVKLNKSKEHDKAAD